jgi:pilus assembly protein CpaF
MGLLSRMMEYANSMDIEAEKSPGPSVPTVEPNGEESADGRQWLAPLDQSPSQIPYLPMRRIRERVQSELLKGSGGIPNPDDIETTRDQIIALLNEALTEENVQAAAVDVARLTDAIANEILGYGPIQPLLDDDTVTEVMVNGFARVFVERFGKLERAPVAFDDDNHVMRIIDKIVSPLGRRVDEASPMVDARLPDGSRVNAIIPPVAIHGPSLTIRRFPAQPFTMDDLIKTGTVNTEMAEFLIGAVRSRLNVIISGGAGTGKTTMLNVLASFIGGDERVVTIEDAAELRLQQPDIVSLEARPPNMDGRGQITIRDLVRNSLRMRPDRIIVGEARSGEALDMLQAMNTGHDGSVTTVHANSPREALSRLESLITMGGYNLPSRTIREMIVGSVDVIVQAERLRDGSRRITNITEVIGTEGDVIITQDLMVYQIDGEDEAGRIRGKHAGTGIARPAFWDRARYFGLERELAESLDAAQP